MPRLMIPMVLSLAMFGCGGGSSTDEASSSDAAGSSSPAAGGAASTGSSDASSGSATPEATFAAFQQAAKDNDWKTAASLMSPESQAMLAGMSVIGSSFVPLEDPAKQKELEALLTKHGIDLTANEKEPTPEELAGGQEAMMMSLTESIPDKPAFIAEINAWMQKNSDEPGGGLSDQFANLGELSDLKVEGDSAAAQIKTEFGPQPIEFRKSGDSWVVHLPTDSPGEARMSDFEEPDDGTPGIGTFWLGEESAKLRQAIAYPSTFFDDPCTVVLLTSRPLPERQLEELKRMLKEDGNDDAFFPRGTHLKVSLDEAGEVVSLFGWAEGMSINGNQGVDVDLTIEGDRVQGKIAMPEAKEIFDTSYRFEADVDAEVLATSGD